MGAPLFKEAHEERTTKARPTPLVMALSSNTA